MEKILFAGSFDPLTNGHLYVIKEGLKIADSVTVLVSSNPSKKYTFSNDTRIKIIQDVIEEHNLQNVKIEVCDNEYVADWADRNGFTHIIRGIRNSVDFDQERLIQRANNETLGNIQTVFIMPPSDLESVSSSFVKGLIGPESWVFRVKDFVSKSTMNHICQKYIIDISDGIFDNEVFYKSMFSDYAVENRYYHNIMHIADMLSIYANEYKDLVTSDTKSMVTSILLHDIIYQQKPDKYGITGIGKSDEQCSYEYSRMFTKVGISTKLILATDYKNFKDEYSELQQILVDIDMSILGRNSSVYDLYAENIRKEYSQFTDESYKKGRIEVLKSIKDNIESGRYLAHPRSQKYKNRAISNINLELQKLS